jgi:outer membrane protein OmpA-like peptidoglycan-associated protein
MKSYFFILLSAVLTLSSCRTTAQSPVYGSKSKKAEELFKKGYSAYRNSYGSEEKLEEAEDFILKAIKKDPEFAAAYLMMGEIEIAKGDLTKAIEYKEQALTINPEYSKNEYFYLARLLMRAGDYKKCKQNSLKFLRFKNTNENFQAEARQMIQNCDFAEEAIKSPVPFHPKNLGKNINTDRAEYFPTFTGDGNTILFTRRILEPKAIRRGGQQEDFFTSSKENEEWKEATPLSNTINSFFNEGAPTLSADGNFLIFTSCQGSDGEYGDNRTGKGSCDLFYARRIGDRWGKPRNLGSKINTRHWESQPCFSADGRTLYFIRAIKSGRSLDPDNQDIYVTRLQNSGYWTEPEKLSNKINTPLREESVFIHPDGQTLYFGSNGHPGMGGMDLYYSRLQENGEWGTPINLGYPINTSGNENSIVVSPDGTHAYFASDREGGFGDLDLYSFELPEKAKPIYASYMKGIVYDQETKEKLSATFEIIDISTNEVLLVSHSDPVTGKFLVNIPTNKNLAINVAKKGYFFYSKSFTVNSTKEPQNTNIPLSKIEVSDKPFVLENIFFDVAKYNLKQESRAELDKLYELMVQNEAVRIEIGGHTDSDGNAKQNQELSEKRAKSVVNYLVLKGIDISRLTHAGYGSSKPRASNDSEKNKALNRRTEVKIIGN